MRQIRESSRLHLQAGLSYNEADITLAARRAPVVSGADPNQRAKYILVLSSL